MASRTSTQTAGESRRPRWVLSTIDSPHWRIRHRAGAQAASRPFLVGVEPQHPGDVVAADGLLVQREEGEDALSGGREINALAISAELEGAGQ